jgi:hypothetical protein
MMRGCARKALLTFVLVLAAAASVRAQRVVRFVGHGEPDLDARIRQLLAGPYLLIARDTVLPQGQTVQGNVLVVRSTTGIEGTVQGTVLDLDANLFVRPTAHITGDLVNLGGGLYRSELSKTDGTIVNRPLAPYRVDIRGDTVDIEGFSRNPSVIALMPALPSYDRVNGLTVRAAAALRIPAAGRIEPEIRGKASFRTARTSFGGGAELALIHNTSMLKAGFEREAVTNETWMIGDVINSVAFLFAGNDYRNYYEADRVYAEALHEFRVRRMLWGFSLRAQREDGTALRAHNPFAFTGRHFRENFPTPLCSTCNSAPLGRISSATLSGHGGWAGVTAALQANASVEIAGTVAGGDQSFKGYKATGEYAMQGIANHALDVYVYAQGPLPGTDDLPFRRWSTVGGAYTLFTYPVGFFLGDRVAYERTQYLIPGSQRFRLPFVGAPDLTLIHVAGMAWTRTSHRKLEQNLALQLQALVVYVWAAVNPADRSQHEIGFGLGLPVSRRPWERVANGPAARIRSRY